MRQDLSLKEILEANTVETLSVFKLCKAAPFRPRIVSIEKGCTKNDTSIAGKQCLGSSHGCKRSCTTLCIHPIRLQEGSRYNR